EVAMPLRFLLVSCIATLGSWASSANSLEAQAPKEPGSLKDRAIEYRLLQPISLQLKDVTLRQAIKDIATHSGVPMTLDLPALKAAHVDLDAPLTIEAGNIKMKSALNNLLKPLNLAFVGENNANKIMPGDQGKLVRIVY